MTTTILMAVLLGLTASSLLILARVVVAEVAKVER
jgi:hypothetical protein